MSISSLPTGVATDITLTEQASARTLITAVMHRYASLGREGCDWDAAEALFEPSADYILPDGTVLPPSRIQEVVKGNEAKYIRHHITTIDIQFTTADEAQAESYFFAATEYKFQDHWGRWKDVFRRQDDGTWLIKRRAIILEGHDPEGWTARTYGDKAFAALSESK